MRSPKSSRPESGAEHLATDCLFSLSLVVVVSGDCPATLFVGWREELALPEVCPDRPQLRRRPADVRGRPAGQRGPQP
jgi:hypothetical protein